MSFEVTLTGDIGGCLSPCCGYACDCAEIIADLPEFFSVWDNGLVEGVCVDDAAGVFETADACDIFTGLAVDGYAWFSKKTFDESPMQTILDRLEIACGVEFLVEEMIGDDIGVFPPACPITVVTRVA